MAKSHTYMLYQHPDLGDGKDVDEAVDALLVGQALGLLVDAARAG